MFSTFSNHHLHSREFGVEQDTEDIPEPTKVQECPWYIIRDSNRLRHKWGVLLVMMLVYTGTIFPYRLCFVVLNLRGDLSDSLFWDVVDRIVDVGFIADLISGFFFSYISETDGEEVYDFRRIASRYLRGQFLLNLIACFPPELGNLVIDAIEGMGDNDHHGTKNRGAINKTARLTRLQRVSRLARLARLARVVKIFKCFEIPAIKKLQQSKYIKPINLVCGLFFVVHLIGCGWYLTAWFHENHADTWIERRGIYDASPWDQWVNSNYFVLTVFTTVGFGDISAFTIGEIFYCTFVMIVGAIVHSMIMGEVINALVSVDKSEAERLAQQDLVQSFAEHAKLDASRLDELSHFFKYNRNQRNQIDKKKLESLLTSSVVPRELMRFLASGLFDGALEINKFMTSCHARNMPIRFPLLLALSLNERKYALKEMVYCAYDSSWNVFLVVKGTFSYVAFASDQGALKQLPRTGMEGSYKSKSDSTAHSVLSTFGTGRYPFQLFGPRTYFGDLELLLRDARGRFSDARCESDGGQALVLHKNDLFKLIQDFGPIGVALRARAIRRNEKRLSAMHEHRIGRNLENFAAATIQKYTRKMLQKAQVAAPHSIGSRLLSDRNSGRHSEVINHGRDSQIDNGSELRALRHDMNLGFANMSLAFANITEEIRLLGKKVQQVEAYNRNSANAGNSVGAERQLVQF